MSLINAVILCLLGYKFLQILQLSDYKLTGYIEWAKDTKAKYLGRMLSLVFLSLACSLVINACLVSYWQYISYISLIPYIILSIIFRVNVINAKMKTPLKSTYRMTRLVSCLFIICALASFGLLQLSEILPNYLHETIITLSPILLVFLVPLAHLINLPGEELNKLRHIKIAKRKLKKYPYLIRIGITGSYGKTSTKYILNSILSSKYNVCMTPHSFNTAMGLCQVVDKYLEPYHEVLIAEMGANTCGDIAFLCNIIEPQMGIITGVGNQHLRTFYTRNNIKNTKYELVKHIENKENATLEDWAAYTSRIKACGVIEEGKPREVKSLFFGETKTMKQEWWKLQKLEEETYLKIITGEVSIDEFDRFVDDWKEHGGNKILEEVSATISK